MSAHIKACYCPECNNPITHIEVETAQTDLCATQPTARGERLTATAAKLYELRLQLANLIHDLSLAGDLVAGLHATACHEELLKAINHFEQRHPEIV